MIPCHPERLKYQLVPLLKHGLLGDTELSLLAPRSIDQKLHK